MRSMLLAAALLAVPFAASAQDVGQTIPAETPVVVTTGSVGAIS